MAKKTGIIDGGDFYHLTDHGPWIDKFRGTGVILGFLRREPGRVFSLEAIASATGWVDPARNMYRLAAIVNAWSKHEKIVKEGSGYMIRRVRKR